MTTQSLPAIGTTLENGIVSAIIANLAGDGYDALLVLTDEAGTVAVFEPMPWGEYGTETEGADSDVDGKANTEAMAKAGSEQARHALALGGHIPAQRELQAIYANHKDVVPEDWYWSSTQYSAYGA